MKMCRIRRTSLVNKSSKKMTQYVGYDELMEYSMETCEFCDDIFHTKLDKYTHNADHVIIPIIRDLCVKCNSQFSTNEAFTKHNCMKLQKVKTEEVISLNLKVELLKDIALKRPVVVCDKIKINSILLDKKTQIKQSEETLFKSLKELVVIRDKDTVAKQIASTSDITGQASLAVPDISGTARDANTDLDLRIGIQPVILKPEMNDACEVAFDCDDQIVISDSESDTSNSNECIKKWNHIIDTSCVTITKLEKSHDIECKTEEFVPNFDYEDSNDFDFIQGFVNEADAQLEVHEEFNQESVNDGLKDFIKKEMKENDFELLFKSDIAFSESIKSKLIFDDDPDELLNNNLITLNNVKYELEHENENDSSNCIGYSDLKYEENVNCKYCSKVFPNLYNLIIHEGTHLRLKPSPRQTPICPICDVYVAGNYRVLAKHILKKHPLKQIKKSEKHKCSECHLTYYNYDRHSKHYHKRRLCYVCKEKFFDKKNFEKHVCSSNNDVQCLKPVFKHNTKESTKLCEVCSLFKCQKYFRYVYVGSLCEIGKTFQCDKCGKNFFEVKKYLRSSLNTKIGKPHKTKSKPTVTDERKNRLKNIWKRLKRIQYVNRK